jgi:hypothetical protein
VKKRLFAILMASCALLVACKRPAGEAPTPMPAVNQDAIKALGSTMPEPNYDRSYWLKQHDANTREWQEARRLCEQTVLTNYPNCLPVNDIVQADQRKKAEAGNEAAAKIEEMGRQGYGYDYQRKEWLPDHDMLATGCTCVPAYPSNPARIGFYTWRCPPGKTIPKGIPDSDFSKEEERATD